MRFLLFLFLATALQRPFAPYVRSDLPGEDRCGPPTPCPGRLLLVHNPSRELTRVVVRCKDDRRTDVSVDLAGRAEALVDVALDGGLSKGDCVIDRWFRF